MFIINKKSKKMIEEGYLSNLNDGDVVLASNRTNYWLSDEAPAEDNFWSRESVTDMKSKPFLFIVAKTNIVSATSEFLSLGGSTNGEP